jgi:hypothetical protein
MRVTRSLVSSATVAVLAGTIGMSAPVSQAFAGSNPGSQAPATRWVTGMANGCPMHTTRDAHGNCVEHVDPSNSTYIPDVSAASARARNRAQRLQSGTNAFCQNRSLAALKANWRAGTTHPLNPTHYFNPDHSSRGTLHARNPIAALVYDGKIGGVMLNGAPLLPHLGSIPRAHMHGSMQMGSTSGIEMLHVYCTSSLTAAFTPNRLLGVKAAMITLRLKIRPAVMDLRERQLRAVRHKVRGYCGDRLNHIAPVGSGDGGPDPVLQAMRTEIRNSLMLLTETQLRHVWHLVRSYRS